MPHPRSPTRSDLDQLQINRARKVQTDRFGHPERMATAVSTHAIAANTFLYSNTLRARARAVIPGGASGSATGDAHYPLLSPGFIRSGKGCRVVDADGRSFIEFGAGTCPVGLGHAHPAIVGAVEAALRTGVSFSRTSEREPDAAEALLSIVPKADMVRFFSSEAEALATATLLARAATGRDSVIRVRVEAGGETDRDGAPALLHENSVGLDIFRRNPSASIAAVVIDPADGDEPASGFLADAIATSHRHGALVILDETTTGFRWATGGAQEVYGATPDLSVFGSGATNGLAFAALTGSRPLMRMLPKIEQSSQLAPARGAGSHCLAAMMAVIRLHRSHGIADAIGETGRRLTNGVRERIRHHGADGYLSVRGRACRPFLDVRDADRRPSTNFNALLMQETIRRGILMPTLAPSIGHDHEAVEMTLDAIDGALEVFMRAIEDGVGRYLVGRSDGDARTQ